MPESTNFGFPWVPDSGDGTYRNPIILADYSDPDVVRHGDDFYLIASSFNCTPGLPILHSRDLVNWTLVNHAVRNLPNPRFAEVQTGAGVWAPAIRFHNGKFWIFFPMPDEGIYITTASDPRAEWSEPHLVIEGKGLIDPCPLWDDDGQAYLVHAYARSRSGIKNRLRVRPMAPDGSRLLGEGEIVYDNEKVHPTLEGPKFLKKDGWYTILAPACGVSTGWQVAFRSRHIYGPYEDKIVLAQGTTPINGPHQGALVETSGGQWWFVHFQDADVYGRIVHLQPVEWTGGWPMMGVGGTLKAPGEPVLRHTKPRVAAKTSLATPQTSDDFSAPPLGLQWQWEANHEPEWYSLTMRPGSLRLFARPLDAGLRRAPHLLLQKFPARAFRVQTEVELSATHAGTSAGMVVMGQSHAALAVRHGEVGHEVVYIVDGEEKALVKVGGSILRFKIEVRDGGLCQFEFSEPGRDWVRVEPAFQARKGHWIGARVGLYCGGIGDAAGGFADFDSFQFSAPATAN